MTMETLPKYKTCPKCGGTVRFIELFAGIGGFRYGLEKVYDIPQTKEHEYETKDSASRGQGRVELNKADGLGYTCVWANEIDKYAAQIYRKHYGGGELYEGDITKVEARSIPDHDLLCAGFPCQSFSIAGKRGGFEDTRGTMFFEIARIAQEKLPQYLLLENVKGLLSHNKGWTFGLILSTLDELGYDCQWQVLNSKNFGVPQNRERVFIIGHLRGGCRPEVFPIGGVCSETSKVQPEAEGQQKRILRNSKSEGGYFASPENWRDAQGRPRIRRLTPTECERLQSFPDGWTEGGLTKVQFCGNIPYNHRRYICDRYVGLRVAVEKLYREKMGSASYITRGSDGEERQINISHRKENVSIVDEPLLQEISATDITNLGSGMVTLCNQNGICESVEKIKKNLTQEKMARKSILPLWKICLAESCNQERLFTILTWIKEITRNPICTYAGTEEPITNVIIHGNWLESNCSSEASFNLKMADIVSVSDTQRYKCLGNAVTTNVITAIGSRLANENIDRQ